MANTVHIAVLDDHRMFLEGISMMVENMSDAYTVTNFHDPAEALTALTNGKKFDLILCDLIMDRMNGLAFLAAVRAHSKKLPVLMLSGITTTAPVAEMKRLGANGFVHKASDNETLSKAVESVLSGKHFFLQGEEQGTLGTSVYQQDDMLINPLPTLGKRQVEVLKMIAEGASNKEISRSLDITENTVKTHLKQIFIAMNVNKRTACIRKAQTLGML